jgi:mono/diheme cytochrome c family protein
MIASISDLRALKREICIAFVLVASAAATSVGADPSTSSDGMSRGWTFGERGGADLFNAVCAACHQRDGQGAVGAAAYPPLAGDKKLASSDFILSALFGGMKDMPPVGRMMSDEQAAEVVNYVRTHFGNSYPDSASAADASSVRRQFSEARP